jgi:hypothetical protein
MIIKGKIPIMGWNSKKRKANEEEVENESGLWKPQEEGWTEVEVDGAFVCW